MIKRVAEFETDEDGTPKLAGNEALCKSARYERVPRRSYVPNRLKDKAAVANWVRDAVVGDLETLDRGITCRTDPQAGGGNFLLLIGCMMAIEYFATIFDGASKRAAHRAVAYARAFMAKPRYETCLPLLMAARNGIAHGSWPSRVRVGEEQYPFAVGYDYPESCVHLHLSWHKAEGEVEATQKLFVNPRTMLIDLKESVMREPNGFRHWVLESADEKAVERAQPSLIECSDADLSVWK